MSKPAPKTSLLWLATVALFGWGLLQGPERGRADSVRSAEATARPAPVSPALTLETRSYSATFSAVGGGLSALQLKGDRYRQGDRPLNMVSTDKAAYLPLSFGLTGLALDPSTPMRVLNSGPQAVRLEASGNGFRVIRKYTAGQGPYQLWVTTRVINDGAQPLKVALSTKAFHYAPRSDEEGAIPFLPVRSPWLSHGVCMTDEDVEREDRSSLVEEGFQAGNVAFAGTENIYFLGALAPHGENGHRCILSATDRGRDAAGEPLGTLFETALERAPRSVEPGAETMFRTLAYFGPKTPETLAAAGHQLSESIDGGWFSALAKLLTLLLRMIHDMLDNWGSAIILLTFIVKALLYPLTAKQMKSMGRMKELKPEMDRINELYKDDSQGKGAAMMELYREKGVNPMAGCLPMLVQLPIWFSLYASLSSNVELFHAPFLGWLSDLSSPDPYFVLPIGLGALMFLQQKMTPASGMDPAQQKMMLYMMPTMMMAFMLFLPAGLCLYMFTNSALSIGQQRLIESQLAKSSSNGGLSSPLSSPISSAAAEVASGETSQRTKPSRPSKAERRSRRGK